MSLPRNHETHPENRQSVGGYLYGKLGRLGLLSHMHTFQAKRPAFKGRRRAMMGADNNNIEKVICICTGMGKRVGPWLRELAPHLRACGLRNSLDVIHAT